MSSPCVAVVASPEDDGILAPSPPSVSKPEIHPQESTLTCSTASTLTTRGSESSIDIEDAFHDQLDVDDGDEECDDADDVGGYFAPERVEAANRRAGEENERLNLNLGMPLDLTAYTRPSDAVTCTTLAQRALRPPVRLLLRLLDRLLAFVESPLFRFWEDKVPLRFRQKLTFLAWGMYLPVHRALVGRRTGLNRGVSLEYHALTTVMWWGRLFPVTVKRMRFSLSQLHVWHPPDKYPRWNALPCPSPDDAQIALTKPGNGERHGIRGHLYEVYHRMERKRTPTGVSGHPSTEASPAEMTVTGQYIQHSSKPSEKVIFWIFGGAFLAGDSRGNVGIAEKMGLMCGEGDDWCGVRDVFVPDYRLVPEHHLDDFIHDIALAYEYLIYERGARPENVTLVGVSSGGGLVVLLLQALARARREYDGRNDVDGSGPVPMPAGGVLMGPFVDYTEPMGTMKEYIRHDLIVNQSVYDEGIPYLEKVLGSHENRVRASPVYGNFEGLPPLCVCVSEHEVVYDQAMVLAERARERGVDVTVGVWKYMCHVFPLLCPFIPEGRESFDFMCEWIKKH